MFIGVVDEGVEGVGSGGDGEGNKGGDNVVFEEEQEPFTDVLFGVGEMMMKG